MHGSHHLIVQSAHLKYELDIKRNITVIKGDSATGKTTLADMIREYVLNGTDTGITVSCDVLCRLLEGNTWQEQLSLINNSIVFVDEGNSFVSSLDFANAVKNSTNYFVIITRENLHALPYSVNEIYGIHSSGKYNSLEPVYHELYHIYGNSPESIVHPDVLIAEDSNSGFDFFSSVSADKIKCISAKGKANIFNLLSSGEIEGNVLIIADGAAFGAQMANVFDLAEKNESISLYLPESFEWIILDSDVLNDAEVRRILQNPEDYIDGEKYFSWERFFTSLLVEKSSDSYLKYTKNKLNPAYLDGKVLSQILSSIPAQVDIHDQT
ncbi:hypothetical protein SAMN02745229_03622 [Butyrivibrio fibrisolvens DSM 3071]|uniref:Translation initiation factor 2 n=1 Tax=Butyrivibrio fibrisolvens DSM 3071 TaxID=1121131 RepID=A0A1M6DZ45_BUTFI|nr:translation initiation factor 2 [Butyrivibrio fibrisolvens]SHI78413.1 hypothetical protein SAMN02745229_03622 [Butyrivibrio fibrisolvens DSM 3071]